jgi:sarcosine oxidase subunit gamma
LSGTSFGRGGLIVRERDGLGIATLLARKDKSAALARRVRERFQGDLPNGPRRAAASNIAFVGIGPGAWLVTNEQGGNDFVVSLREAAADLAGISDQSDGYAVLRLSGPKVRDVLCKLVPVDMHPRVFKVGDVAATVAAHIGSTLWRLEDEADGSAIFEISLFRSFAASFWHALSKAAVVHQSGLQHSARRGPSKTLR